jgi:hypothetical protein
MRIEYGITCTPEQEQKINEAELEMIGDCGYCTTTGEMDYYRSLFRQKVRAIMGVVLVKKTPWYRKLVRR